jgi:hypothetical protein
MASELTLDETYLYWTVYQDPRHIFRYPLAGGQVETVATTRFDDGDLTTYEPLRSGDWLIYTDTHENDNTAWVVRALNLKTGMDQVVVEEPGDPASWPGPWLGAEGDWVAWTRTGHAADAPCDQSILALCNLRTGEQRELDRTCTENGYMWVFPRLAGNTLVVEQDLPDNKGRGNNIYAFDLTTGQRTALTENGASSMPDLSDQWIVWKAGARFQYSRAVILYNRATAQEQVVWNPNNQPLDPHLAGHWLYQVPPPMMPLYVYDVETQHMVRVVTPGQNEAIESVVVYNNVVAWLRNLDFAHAMPHDNLLEWRTLP